MKLWPRSLAGRLAALLVFTLIIAQIVSFLLFAGERITAFRSAYRDDLVTRLISLVQLLEETPPELHDRLLATANSLLLHLDLTREPLLAESGESLEHLREALADALDKQNDTVRLSFGRENWRSRGRRPPAWINLSLRLKSGQWLNASAEMPPVP